MNPTNAYYRDRTRKLALRIVQFLAFTNSHPGFYTMTKQLIRCACSSAANYRAMCLARSPAEYFSKLCIVVEESDETVFWIEMLIDSGLISDAELGLIKDEAQELAKTFTSYRAKIRPVK